MNYPRIFLCIFIMAAVTYLTRMPPLVIFKKKITNRFVKSFLAYVPYAVLSAMTFPEILYSTGNMVSAVFGLVAALLLAYKGRGLLTVAVGSVAVVFIVEQVLQYALI